MGIEHGLDDNLWWQFVDSGVIRGGAVDPPHMPRVMVMMSAVKVEGRARRVIPIR